MSKVFEVRSGTRLKVNLDIYNVFNDGSLLALNNNYGEAWLRPANRGIVAPRLFQFGGQLSF